MNACPKQTTFMINRFHDEWWIQQGVFVVLYFFFGGGGGEGGRRGYSPAE